MYNLALFYQKGEGTGQNENEAEKWFKSAADKGQSDANYNLKQIELTKKGGLGVPPKASGPAPQILSKPAEAASGGAGIALAEYCLIAAQRGNPDAKCDADLAKQSPPTTPSKPGDNDLNNYVAQAKTGNPQAENDLGVLYRRGMKGAKKNPTEAQKLFENAASQGSTNGMMNLASMYKDGDVQQNLELSYAWYNLVAFREPVNSVKRTKAQENIKEIAAHLSNQQIGNSLQYAAKLDEKIPVVKDSESVSSPTPDSIKK